MPFAPHFPLHSSLMPPAHLLTRRLSLSCALCLPPSLICCCNTDTSHDSMNKKWAYKMFTSCISIYFINSCVVACQFAIGISQCNYEPLHHHITWHHMTSCDIVSQFMLTFVIYHYHGRRRWRVQQTSMLKYTSLANIHTLSNTRPTGAKIHGTTAMTLLYCFCSHLFRQQSVMIH